MDEKGTNPKGLYYPLIRYVKFNFKSFYGTFLQAIAKSFLVLYPLVNPVGAVPLFCTLTNNGTNEYREKMAFKTALDVIIILIVFLFVGKLRNG
jgi:hypothetical protein